MAAEVAVEAPRDHDRIPAFGSSELYGLYETAEQSNILFKPADQIINGKEISEVVSVGLAPDIRQHITRKDIPPQLVQVIRDHLRAAEH